MTLGHFLLLVTYGKYRYLEGEPMADPNEAIRAARDKSVAVRAQWKRKKSRGAEPKVYVVQLKGEIT
jgi:hypothetical protein